MRYLTALCAFVILGFSLQPAWAVDRVYEGQWHTTNRKLDGTMDVRSKQIWETKTGKAASSAIGKGCRSITGEIQRAAESSARHRNH